MKAQTIAPEALIPGRAGLPGVVSPKYADSASDVAPAFRPATPRLRGRRYTVQRITRHDTRTTEHCWAGPGGGVLSRESNPEEEF
jgi:hypothetical protein